MGFQPYEGVRLEERACGKEQRQGQEIILDPFRKRFYFGISLNAAVRGAQLSDPLDGVVGIIVTGIFGVFGDYRMSPTPPKSFSLCP